MEQEEEKREEKERLIGYIVLMMQRMRYENVLHLYRIAQRMH